jgi:hypothetical protein
MIPRKRYTYPIYIKGKTAVTQETPKKKSNWRQKHAEFQRMVKSGRKQDEAESSQFQEVVPNPDYVMCQHCDRRFNELAAERHKLIKYDEVAQ